MNFYYRVRQSSIYTWTLFSCLFVCSPMYAWEYGIREFMYYSKISNSFHLHWLTVTKIFDNKNSVYILLLFIFSYKNKKQILPDRIHIFYFRIDNLVEGWGGWFFSFFFFVFQINGKLIRIYGFTVIIEFFCNIIDNFVCIFFIASNFYCYLFVPPLPLPLSLFYKNKKLWLD